MPAGDQNPALDDFVARASLAAQDAAVGLVEKAPEPLEAPAEDRDDLDSARGDIEQTRAQPFMGARRIDVDLPSGTSKVGNPLERRPAGILAGIPSAAVYVYQTPADVAVTDDKVIQVTTSGACTVALWVL
jgi:hypothetical protein